VSSTLTYIDDHTLTPLVWHQQAMEWCHEMRATRPVFYDEKYGWFVFRHQEVSLTLSDYVTYSSEYDIGLPPEHEESRVLIMMDPPQHRRLRTLLTQAFSARTIAQMEPQIESIVGDLLEQISAHEQTEFIGELASPLPIIVIAEMLGLPREDWRIFKKWTDVQVTNAPGLQEILKEMADYFFTFLAEKRKHPDTKLISLLLAAESEGKQLSDQELFSFFNLLLVAGNITTTNLLGNAMLCFDLFPDALAQLHKNPALAANTIEETLRYMSPARVFTPDVIGSRIIKADTMLADVQFRKGDVVRPIIFSANFDEQQFVDPERFDITRHPNRHLSFGHGIHFCLGAPLARLEARIVLAQMVKRFANWEIQERDSLEQMNSELVLGLKRLPMKFQPA
jgi:cytochrome P450 family 109